MNAVVEQPVLPEAELVQMIIARVPDVQAVLLYGSFARGEAWPGSDVDLAVLLPARLDARLAWNLSADLGVVAGRDVSCVDARRIPPTLRAALIEDARPLYLSDATALAEWEAQSFTALGLLNHERGDLLRDFWSGADRMPQ